MIIKITIIGIVTTALLLLAGCGLVDSFEEFEENLESDIEARILESINVDPDFAELEPFSYDPMNRIFGDFTETMIAILVTSELYANFDEFEAQITEGVLDAFGFFAFFLDDEALDEIRAGDGGVERFDFLLYDIAEIREEIRATQNDLASIENSIPAEYIAKHRDMTQVVNMVYSEVAGLVYALYNTSQRSTAVFENIVHTFQATMDDALDMWIDAIAL